MNSIISSIRNAFIAAVFCSLPIAHAWGQSEQVVVGIGGHYRVGCWTAVRISDDSLSLDSETMAIETQDGEGLTASYRQKFLSGDDRFGYVIPGSEAAPLVIRDQTGVHLSTRFPELASPSLGPSQVPLGMPWIVSIGDPLGVESIGANEILGRAATVAVSRPQDARGLPDRALGYDGVDLIMIGESGSDILQQLTEHQRQAIRQWVVAGGRMFVTMGESTPKLFADASWLADLLPVSVEGVEITAIDPSAIETFTSTQDPLRQFSGIKLPKGVGEPLIMGRTVRRVSTPLAARYIAGLGQVTVIAADLESEPFSSWPDRLVLVTGLLNSTLKSKDDRGDTVANRATAYNDLAGQARLTLDQFSLKRSFSFSLISLVLMGLIAAIGPLDYLLINRVLGRPLLGWLTFPIVAIGLSAVLAVQSRHADAGAEPVRDSAATSIPLMRCNQLEFVDIDSIKGYGRGFSWHFVYSHDARKVDITAEPSERINGISTNIGSVLVKPYGYAGESFGGIQIAGDGSMMPGFDVVMKSTDERLFTHIRGLPIAPRSSKSIATRFSFTPSVKQVELRRRSGSDLLEGRLANPLNIDLTAALVIYQNLVYRLPQRFPAGGVIESISDLQQKNFRWQMSRQRYSEKKSLENEAWDPSAKNDLHRVAEMLMFHQVVGGTNYTSLKDDPLSFLDLSELLAEDRCILLGTLDGPTTQLTFTESESSGVVSDPEGQKLAIMRLVLPVDTNRQ